MIVETLVTTVDSDGRCNLAPMGPHLDSSWERDPARDPQFELKPFVGSRTERNLSETGWAVIHFSDDSGLFARTCVGSIDSDELHAMTCPVDSAIPVRRLIRCLRYFVVRVDSIAGRAPRLTMPCTVHRSSVVDAPRGINRGSLAVIEAAILATRTHLIPADEIRDSIQRLTPLVEKTAGDLTRSAFNQICEEIEHRLSVVTP